MMTRGGGQIADIWNAPSRERALQIAVDSLGEDGTKMLTQAAAGPALPASDLALFSKPEWLRARRRRVRGRPARGRPGLGQLRRLGDPLPGRRASRRQ